MKELKLSLENYLHEGVVKLEGVFSQNDIETLEMHLRDHIGVEKRGVVYEQDGVTVRGIHGIHLYHEFFSTLVKQEKLLGIVRKTLGDNCYVPQSKVNVKKKGVGEFWPWHQDFVFWHKNDHIEKEELVNIAIFLDDVDFISGPLWFIPNSHTQGNLCQNITLEAQPDKSWSNDVASALTFQVPIEEVDKQIQMNGVAPAIGKKGDVIVFHPQTIHGSPNNLGPTDRRLLILTYNKVSNVSKSLSSRPEFLCSPVTY